MAQWDQGHVYRPGCRFDPGPARWVKGSGIGLDGGSNQIPGLEQPKKKINK